MFHAYHTVSISFNIISLNITKYFPKRPYIVNVNVEIEVEDTVIVLPTTGRSASRVGCRPVQGALELAYRSFH